MQWWKGKPKQNQIFGDKHLVDGTWLFTDIKLPCYTLGACNTDGCDGHVVFWKEKWTWTMCNAKVVSSWIESPSLYFRDSFTVSLTKQPFPIIHIGGLRRLFPPFALNTAANQNHTGPQPDFKWRTWCSRRKSDSCRDTQVIWKVLTCRKSCVNKMWKVLQDLLPTRGENIEKHQQII